MISNANANEKETIASNINKTIIPYIESKTLIVFVFVEVISKIIVVSETKYFQ
tara:strand:- start:1070 stop:1228 length:159 start_codon:yes stop_codon:yes gene_type:complete